MKLTMVGRLDECLLLAYRTPVESVRHLVPAGLELLTRGPFAFWNVVACLVQRMRPTGTPAALGLTYHHIAYRLYVRCRTAHNGTLDGLYFVRSDADNTLVSRLGNLLSDFRFHHSTISLRADDGGVTLRVRGQGDPQGDADLCVASGQQGDPRPQLAPGSPFSSVEEAATFLKYRPLGLSSADNGRRIRLAEVFRDESGWRETPVSVTGTRWSFFENLGQSDIFLETATRVAPIDYRWRLGASVAAG